MTDQPRLNPQLSTAVTNWLQTRREPHSPLAQACEAYCQARYRQEFGHVTCLSLRELDPGEREPPLGVLSVTRVRRGVECFVREFEEMLIPWAKFTWSVDIDKENRTYRLRVNEEVE